MPISGNVPKFDLSPAGVPAGDGTAVVVTITGGATGLPNGTHSSEGLAEFYQRAVNVLAISGLTLTSGQLSGIRAIQREMAYRAADVFPGDLSDARRLAIAQSVLAVSGEAQF